MGLSPIKAPLSSANWAMALLCAFVSLSAFLGGLEAFADGPNDWTDSRYYVECGQDCLYNKANEKVTLQAMFLVKKMTNLGQVLETRDPEDAGHVISELKIYCPDVPDGAKDYNKAQTCYKRYVQTQLPILRAMKTTLVKNEDMAARLNSNQGAFQGVKSTNFEDATPGTRKPQVSEFQKESELLLSSKTAGDRIAYLSKESYAQWANEMSRLQPKLEDFPKTEDIVISDPNSVGGTKTLTRIQMKDGLPQYDNSAFLHAKQEFDAHINGVNQKTEFDLRKVAKRFEKTPIFEVDPNVRAQMNAFKPGSKNLGTTKIDDVSYTETRNQLLGEKMKNAAKGVYTQNYPGAPKIDRKTASAATNGVQAPSNSASKVEQIDKEEKQGYAQVTQPVVDASPPPAGQTNVNETLSLRPKSLDDAIESFQQLVDVR